MDESLFRVEADPHDEIAGTAGSRQAAAGSDRKPLSAMCRGQAFVVALLRAR